MHLLRAFGSAQGILMKEKVGPAGSLQDNNHLQMPIFVCANSYLQTVTATQNKLCDG